MWQKCKNIYHLFQAILANIYYQFPSKKLTVIGVTGTDGKTTTVNLIYHILKTANKTVSMISTVGANIHGQQLLLGFHVTSPAAWPLQKFLSLASKTTIQPNFLVLEVSSHALDQNRVWGIPFAIGVITNITPEHLDYHKTFDNYVKAKISLLKKANISIINRDDNSYNKIISFIPNKKIITFGLHANADVTEKIFSYQSPLMGEFNRYNVLAAISVCKQLGISNSDIKKGIETFTTPIGRMNPVSNKRGLHIYIDYAHTANGIEQAITALKKNTKGKLIVLVGAEGYRDEKKRSVIGEFATKHADYVIVTAVDPRGLQKEINEQILQGVKKAGGIVNKNVFVIDDRQEAITFAINSLAKKGDTIGLLGKGHERSMNMDGKHELPWSEYDAIEKALTEK